MREMKELLKYDQENMSNINTIFQIQQLILYKKFDEFYEKNKDVLFEKESLKLDFYKFMWFEIEENISLYTKFHEYIFYKPIIK